MEVASEREISYQNKCIGYSTCLCLHFTFFFFRLLIFLILMFTFSFFLLQVVDGLSHASVEGRQLEIQDALVHRVVGFLFTVPLDGPENSRD